jgi:hypothetical protein
MKTTIWDQTRSRGRLTSRSILLLPAVLCAICVLCALPAAAVHSAASDRAPLPATSNATPVSKHVAHNQKEELYFERRYGIGQLRVHLIASGALLEFRCQVLDASKAKALKAARAAPVTIERKTGTKLSVPATENSSKSSQTAALEAGKEYRVVFGNRDKIVKPGNMVDLVIGTVHMAGLIVE